MNLQSAFGGTIRKLRTERNLTLRQLAAKSWTSIGHMSDIERSIKQPSFDLLSHLVLSMGLTHEQFLNEVIEYMREG
jgi:transcriptional regulator with XRE-family HTH domain